MSNKQLRIIIASALIIIIIAIAAIITHKPALKLSKAVSINTRSQPFIGNAQSKNNIVVFEDMKCINCMRYNTTLFPKIKKSYIDTGKAKYTIITLAFIEGSPMIANAVLCAHQQNKKLFFPYVEYIYQHQGDETKDWGTIPLLLNYAKNINGLNTKKLASCLVQTPFTQQLNKNMSIAEKTMGDSVATPRVYINGVAVEPMTFDNFKAVFDKVSK